MSPSPGLQQAAKAIRVLTVDAVNAAGIGHHGLPLGCAELGALLYSDFLKHDPAEPTWPDRDRFVLSAGHGSMLLYSLLHLSGYDLPIEEIAKFRQLGSRTPGHPEVGVTAGVETTTGPLGQGVGNGVGMALTERILAARFGDALVDHRTWVLASDGDLMEGVASEAASFAGHLGLGKLIVFYDDNGITIDGPTSLSFSEDVPRRFEAYGWHTQVVDDGHDLDALRSAIRSALASDDRPHLIALKTHIGRFSPLEDTSKAHGGIGPADTETTRANLGWDRAPFDVPETAKTCFFEGATRGSAARVEWEKRRDRALSDPGTADLWRSMFERSLSGLDAALPDFRGADGMATRAASGAVLNAIAPVVPSLIGGSADLAGSNNTTLKAEGTIERGKFEGRNVNYGVREHGMASIANGMVLHGGLRPYVGTFLVFSDYMRPAIRLAALMGQPVVYVFTHDSIFVGEDGPTHQPVEHAAALRAIPNLEVWRPGDAREVCAAWRAALFRDDGPSALLLSRQSVPTLEADGVEAGTARGGYVLWESANDPELVLIGTGSELSVALEAAKALADEGRRVRVVSLPCLERLGAADAAYREAVLGTAPRLIVEAQVELGLSPLMRPGDRFWGMRGFGESAPYKVLGEHFGFTASNIASLAREMLG